MKFLKQIFAVIIVTLCVVAIISPMFVFANNNVSKNNFYSNEKSLNASSAKNTSLVKNAPTKKNSQFHFLNSRNKNPKNMQDKKLSKKENLLVLGVTGLRFEDIIGQFKYRTYKNLEKFLENSALGNNIVRSLSSATCPADGWLALNTGKRMPDVYRGGAGICVSFEAPYDSGRIHDWNAYVQSEKDSNYGAELGTLASRLSKVKTKAIGLGAAVALAKSNGKHGDYTSASENDYIFAKDVSNALTDNKLVIADLGSIRPYENIIPRNYSIDSYFMAAERGRMEKRQYSQEKMLKRGGEDYYETALSRDTDKMLRRIDTVLSYQKPNQNIILVSLADSGSKPHLQMMAVKGPVFAHKGFISSTSTRHLGLAQNADVHDKILELLGQEEKSSLSTISSTLPAIRQGDVLPNSAQKYDGSRINQLIDRAVHADRIRSIAPVFLVYMICITGLLFLAVGLFMNKHVVNFIEKHAYKNISKIVKSVRLWNALRFISLVVACIPISGLVYNLIPWWRHSMQQVGTIFVSTLIAVIIASICSTTRNKKSLTNPLLIISFLYVIILTLDPLIGNKLLLDSVLGSQSIVGARMYGFGNIMFALFSSAILIFTATLCEKFVLQKKKIAIFTILVAGMVFAVLVDGLPPLGADFGGPPAIIPAFIFLMLILLGIKLNWKKVLLVGIFTVLSVSGIAIFDWSRPAVERTHLGDFVQIVLDGGLWQVIYRKIGANINMLSSPLIVIAIGGVVIISYIFIYPHFKAKRGFNADSYFWLINEYTNETLVHNFIIFKPMIYALTVLHFIGGSINDSGIIIPANAIVLIVPLFLSVWFTWMINIRSEKRFNSVQ